MKKKITQTQLSKTQLLPTDFATKEYVDERIKTAIEEFALIIARSFDAFQKQMRKEMYEALENFRQEFRQELRQDIREIVREEVAVALVEPKRQLQDLIVSHDELKRIWFPNHELRIGLLEDTSKVFKDGIDTCHEVIHRKDKKKP